MHWNRQILSFLFAVFSAGCASERVYDGPARSQGEIVVVRGVNPADPLIPAGFVAVVKKVDGRELSGTGANVELLPGKHRLEVKCGQPGAKPVVQTIDFDAEGGTEYGIGIIRATNDCNVYQRVRGKFEWSYPETISLPLQQRDRWQWGSERKDFDESIIESVPRGQSLNNWREIITFQYYSSQRRRFTKFGDMTSVSARLKEKQWVLNLVCPNSTLQVLREDPDEAIYTWSTNGCKGHEPQFEFARFVRTRNGIHRIAYAKKATEFTDDEKHRWLKTINAATIIQK